jgi:hypothetical protein
VTAVAKRMEVYQSFSLLFDKPGESRSGPSTPTASKACARSTASVIIAHCRLTVRRSSKVRGPAGRPLPSRLKAEIRRELQRLELVLRVIKEVEAERDAIVKEAAPQHHPNADKIKVLAGLSSMGRSSQPGWWARVKTTAPDRISRVVKGATVRPR